MSPKSPGVVSDEETIVRLVCAPMHVHSKRPELNSSFFSHIFTKGASAQRLNHATVTELSNTIETLTSGAKGGIWLGYVQCHAKEIRQIKIGDESNQQLCVYDAALPPPNAPQMQLAEPENPSHAEIHASRRIPEADQMEYRAELAKVFNSKKILSRHSLRSGAVWANLREDLKLRVVPEQWAALI